MPIIHRRSEILMVVMILEILGFVMAFWVFTNWLNESPRTDVEHPEWVSKRDLINAIGQIR